MRKRGGREHLFVRDLCSFFFFFFISATSSPENDETSTTSSPGSVLDGTRETYFTCVAIVKYFSRQAWYFGGCLRPVESSEGTYVLDDVVSFSWGFFFFLQQNGVLKAAAAFSVAHRGIRITAVNDSHYTIRSCLLHRQVR